MRKFILSIVAFLVFAGIIRADSLVLLHTNDTHSMIESDGEGRGGVLPRKVIIDSIRQVEKNVLLIDAGDMVQGTLYFKFFGGEVEYPLMNMLGYDIRVLGNHEFDNGISSLAEYYKKVDAECLSANYDFAQTALKGIFKPYTIKKIGNKKIGFIGLNVDPKGLIAEQNIEGVVWSDIIEVANNTAEFLKKKKKCDLIVAITHIGYENRDGKTTDVELAQQSRYIDIIIGGHSHTLIDPNDSSKYPSIIQNIDGKKVLIAQCGKSGKYLGYIKIDMKNIDTGMFDYQLFPVNERIDKSVYDKRIIDFISKYKSTVDSINSVPVGYASVDLDNEQTTGAFANWAGDYAMYEGQRLADSLRIANPELGLPQRIDLGMMNVGGIRQFIKEGIIYEGQVLSTFPFANRMVIVKIKGEYLYEALSSAARRQGEAISDEVRVVVNKDWSVRSILISGKHIDKEKDYYISTLDYLAWGNDGMEALTKGEIVWSDNKDSCVPILRYIRYLTENGMPVTADPHSRFVEAVDL